jgi:hypothetical protein
MVVRRGNILLHRRGEHRIALRLHNNRPARADDEHPRRPVLHATLGEYEYPAACSEPLFLNAKTRSVLGARLLAMEVPSARWPTVGR